METRDLSYYSAQVLCEDNQPVYGAKQIDRSTWRLYTLGSAVLPTPGLETLILMRGPQ